MDGESKSASEGARRAPRSNGKQQATNNRALGNHGSVTIVPLFAAGVSDHRPRRSRTSGTWDIRSSCVLLGIAKLAGAIVAAAAAADVERVGLRRVYLHVIAGNRGATRPATSRCSCCPSHWSGCWQFLRHAPVRGRFRDTVVARTRSTPDARGTVKGQVRKVGIDDLTGRSSARGRHGLGSLFKQRHTV